MVHALAAAGETLLWIGSDMGRLSYLSVGRTTRLWCYGWFWCEDADVVSVCRNPTRSDPALSATRVVAAPVGLKLFVAGGPSLVQRSSACCRAQCHDGRDMVGWQFTAGRD